MPGSPAVGLQIGHRGSLPGIAVIVDGEASQLGMLERVREDSEVHFLPALGGG